MTATDEKPLNALEGLQSLVEALPHARLFANLGLVYSFLAVCGAPIPVVIAFSMGDKISYSGWARLIVMVVLAVLFFRVCLRIKKFALHLELFQQSRGSSDLEAAFHAQASFWKHSSWIVLVFGGGILLSSLLDLFHASLNGWANR